MNRITVFLKRINKVQVFSGYLDSVPGFSLYANTCEIKATCTLKRLMNTWWDPGLASSQNLLTQGTWAGSDPSDPYNKDADSGMGQMLGGLLSEVAKWASEDIHIQNIPAGFMKLGLDVTAKEEQLQEVELLKKLLGITSTATAPTTGTLSSGMTPLAITNIGDYQESFASDDFFADFTGPYPAGSDPVERWRPLALIALQQMGVAPGFLDVFVHRIGVESTGDPNVQNNTDSNAQAGHPSISLLQTIASTFRANAVSPYNTHIKSPFGQMCASINYVKNSHWKGDFQAAWGGTHGY
jgi:hypothetical protein